MLATTAIQEQIRALQRKQAAIDLYETIRKTINNFNDPEGHEGLAQEVAASLDRAIDSEIAVLLGKPAVEPTVSPVAPESVHVPAVPVQPAAPKLDPMDPLRFLLAHKHFDGKSVLVQTKDGPVKGVVCGLDAPNIMVRTETGYTVGVPPEKCQIQ